MKQKVVSVLLVLVMALSLLPTAWAETPAGAGGAAMVNGIVYDVLEDAVAGAVDGDTITLLQDVTIKDTLVLDKTVTLDGGAYTITTDATVSWKYDPANENSGNKSLIAMYGGSSAVLKNVTLDGGDLAWGIDIQGVAATLENVTVKNPVWRMVFGVYNAQVTVVGDLISIGSNEGIIELAGIPEGGETSVDITNAALSGISKFYTASYALAAYNVTLDNYDSVFKIIGAADKGFVKRAYYAEDGTLDEVEYRTTRGGTPTKSDDAVASVMGQGSTLYYDNFEAALNYAVEMVGATVTLLKDATVTDTLYLYNGVALNGGGHTITADTSVSWTNNGVNEDDGNKGLVSVHSDSPVVLTNVTLDCGNLAGGIGVWYTVGTLENVTVKSPVWGWVLTAYEAQVTVLGNLTAEGVVGNGRVQLGCDSADGKVSVDIAKATLTGINQFWTPGINLTYCNITVDEYDSMYQVIGAAAKGFEKKVFYWEDGTLRGVAYVPVVDTTDTTVSDVTIPADKTVKIDATDEAAPNARTATVTIEKDTAKKLKEAAARGTVETVEIKTNVATLTIDKAALETLTATEGDLVLCVKKSLVSAAETTFILTAQIDGEDVFTSSLGKVTVTVPVDALGPRQRLVCYYVADDGTRTRMGGAGYQNGSFSWDTNHFSTFVVVTEQVSSSGHSVITINTGKSTSATTFDAGMGIYAVGAILSVTGMAWVGKNGRKKS